VRVKKTHILLEFALVASACSGEVGDGSTSPWVTASGTSSAPSVTDSQGNSVPASTDSQGNPVSTSNTPGSGTSPEDSTSPNASTGNDTSTDPPVTASCQTSAIAPGLILLSDIQFANSIASVLGPDALSADNLPVEELKPFSRKVLSLNTSLVLSRMDWAEDAGNSLVGRVEEATSCTDGDRSCAERYLGEVAKKAFRRPVQASELSDLMSVYDAGAESDYETGVRLAVEAILSAPSFFYRTEFGTPAADGSIQLTPLEVASELSYLLTDRPPDDTLIAAGEDGSLLDPAVRVAQAERLLATEATRTNLTSTMMAAWSFGNLAGVDKDDNMFPTFDGLRSRMYQETKLFLQDIMWSDNTDVSEIMRSSTTFLDGALAEHYGVPFPGNDPNAFVRVEMPPEQRAGMLTHASVMSARSRSDRTSVVSRGIFVRGDLMCLPKISLPDGNPELNELIEEQAADLNATEKEKAEKRAMNAQCGGCHSQFDAFGLPLEYYDPIGRYTPQEEDTAADLSRVGGLEASAASVTSGVELARALADAPQFKSCMTRHMLSYALGADELLATNCEVQELTSGYGTTVTMSDIIRAVAGSPALVQRTAEAAQ
jgi:Protein of unknown function (DUF1592)/Protein of unknown function (DUF1588)/Protein of unknown function (DUF1595)/Protein of unknown function (DUF1585)